METAKSIREDFLQQNAFHEADTFTSLKKQYRMIKVIMHFHTKAVEAIARGVPLKQILEAPVRDAIARAKFVDEKDEAAFEKMMTDIDDQLSSTEVKSRA